MREVRLPSWAHENDRFVLVEVCGNSLKKHRIFNGDLALVYITADIRPGDLVSCLTPEGLMVKYVHKETDERVRLESANPVKYPPKVFDLTDVVIQGKVVRIERDL